MWNSSRFHAGWLLLLLLLLATVQTRASAQSGNNLAAIVAQDGRFRAFNELATTADLNSLLNSNNVLTLFIPSNYLLESMGADSALAARELVLMHTAFGSYDTQTLETQDAVKNAFGKMISVDTANGLRLNGNVRIVTGNIVASNGVIHVVDAVLQSAETTQYGASQTASEPTNPYARPSEPAVHVTNPHQNPAYVAGEPISYRNGILSGAYQCRGMTWTVHQQNGSVTRIGSDRRTNPYRGDAPCHQMLPIACLQRTESPAAPGFWESWAFGSVKATTPVRGNELSSRQAADNICQEAYGAGWRMAEFHDAHRATAIGWTSGHDFSGYGTLPVGVRFWVAIDDQAANPWNSQTPGAPLPGGGGIRTANPGDDPAYIGDRPLRMSESYGLSQGRYGCQGMTWVVHRQVANRVQVGADLSSNPFVGDRSCSEVHHILCIRVDGLRPPANSNGFNYSHGWSGGLVRFSPPVSGHQINERAKANQICQQNFGASWRMAEFHDGMVGTPNSDGWEFWAYGNLPSGRRFWVANNDKGANPWNR